MPLSPIVLFFVLVVIAIAILVLLIVNNVQNLKEGTKKGKLLEPPSILFPVWVDRKKQPFLYSIISSYYLAGIGAALLLISVIIFIIIYSLLT